MDRRHPRASTRSGVHRSELIAFGCVLLTVGVLLPVAISALPSHTSALDAFRALRVSWSMLFVCAGVLQLVRWRLTGEATTAYHGSAMVTFGLVSAPSSMFSSVMLHTEPAVSLGPVTRAACVTACLVLITLGLYAPSVDASLRPVRMTALATATAWAVVLTMTLVSTGISMDQPARHWMGLEVVLVSGWLSCGLVATGRGLRLDRPSLFWAGLCMMTMALAETLRAVAFAAPSPSIFVATGVQLAAATVAVANAGADLGEVFSSEGNHVLSLAGALQDTEERLDEEQRQRDDRLHDARSVIAALKAASFTLERYEERLDDTMKSRLRSSFSSELSRLESVLAARAKEPLRVFPLGVALAPLFAAERKKGMLVNSQLGALRVRGRPLELVTIVQNLLLHARRQAPGSPVTVRAVNTDDTISIHVEDRGPGLAREDRIRVFDRSFRPPAETAGPRDDGLHLHLARRMIREQGGNLSLEPRPGGGNRFVLTLPAGMHRIATDDVTAQMPRQRTGSDDIQPEVGTAPRRRRAWSPPAEAT